jgi:spermidine synthase
MHRHPGKVVHKQAGPEGIFEVVDHANIRSLYFGSKPQQSAMQLDDPIRLILPYTRAMLSTLLFKSLPRSALLIGLGGGSMARFLFHYFPDCEIHAVENRRHVVELAYAYFQLPKSPRLRVHLGDGGEFLYSPTTPVCAEFDLILVDAYDHANIAESVTHETFFCACRQRLTDTGVMAINLWNAQSRPFKRIVATLRRDFLSTTCCS